jgi:hypothetical protein
MIYSENSQLSGIQTYRILIQPEKKSKKIYHFHNQKQIYSMQMFTRHAAVLPAAISNAICLLPLPQVPLE